MHNIHLASNGKVEAAFTLKQGDQCAVSWKKTLPKNLNTKMYFLGNILKQMYENVITEHKNVFNTLRYG